MDLLEVFIRLENGAITVYYVEEAIAQNWSTRALDSEVERYFQNNNATRR